MKSPSQALPGSREAAATLAAASLCCLFLVAPFATAADPPTLPAHPQSLLDTLPKAPDGWKLTRSAGRIVDGAWVITNVERHYEKTALIEGEDPQNPPRTEFGLLDTGQYPSYMARFSGFVPDKKDAPAVDGLRKVLIGPYPAFIEDKGGAGLHITLLARSRYIITLLLKGQPPTAVGIWLEAVNFQALAALPTVPIEELPPELTFLTIDELNPEKNTRYTTSVATGDIAQKIATMVEGRAKEAERAAKAAKDGKQGER